MDLTLIISIVALGFCLLSAFFLIKILSTNKLIQKKLNSQDENVSMLSHKVSGFVNELEEVRSATHAMVRRLKQLEAQVEEVKISQQEVVEQDPQSRFYSKGVKLITQGASVADVMRECEMPLAEAELLFNLHNKPN
ncbi:DUF2802 domain-containing protein [Paraglaciecola sp.]|uniref:DUF2802 domain-containing protein n=1 Tax=Paraglaciecola sp. TaxID=1920173 RepID=UPI003EF76AAD